MSTGEQRTGALIPSAVHRRTWLANALLALLICLSSCAGKHDLSRALCVASPEGAVLDVRVIGSGKPLLLLTGYAMTSEMWDAEFIRRLAASRRVILLDNLGMGPSPAPAAPGTDISIRRMASDAAAVLEALGIDRCDVLGWSMGGMIAQELALSRPDAVCSLVLLTSAGQIAPLLPGLTRIRSMSAHDIQAAMFPPDWLALHPEAPSRVASRPRAPDMAVIQGQLKAILEWEGTDARLADVTAPVLLLAGNGDWLCPPEASRAMHERLSMRPLNPSVLVEFGMGSHWMMHQFPAALAGMVDAFLLAQDCGGPASSPR